MDAFRILEHSVELFGLVMDEQFGGGSRGFHTGVSHQVDDGVVAFMADACDDGQGELCYVFSQ